MGDVIFVSNHTSSTTFVVSNRVPFLNKSYLKIKEKTLPNQKQTDIMVETVSDLQSKYITAYDFDVNEVFAHLNRIFEERIVVLDCGMGTQIQTYRLEENDYRGKCVFLKDHHLFQLCYSFR